MTIGFRIGGADKAADDPQKECNVTKPDPTGYKEYCTIKYKNNRRGIINLRDEGEYPYKNLTIYTITG